MATHRRLAYPTTERDPAVTDDYHGTTVADPYRWLEDPHSDETKAWVAAQNDVTFGYLKEYCPLREPLRKRLEETYNYAKVSCPYERGGRYWFYENSGLQNQSVLYCRETLDAPPTVFLDPNTLSDDGTAALGASKFSESASHFAYGVSRSGSDWQTIHVRDTATGKDLSDKLEWVKFSSIAWTHDDKGFYYSRYPEPKSLATKEQDERAGSEVDKNQNHAIWYHRIGTPQSEDELCYEDKANPGFNHTAVVTHDGRYLLIYVSESCAPVNKLFCVDLGAEKIPRTADGLYEVVKIIDNFDAEYGYVTNQGSKFFFTTNLDAPRYKVVSVDFDDASYALTTVIPESADPIEIVSPTNTDFLLVSTLHDVKQTLMLYTLEGKKVRDFELPSIGTLGGLSTRRKSSEFFFKFVSFLHPGTVYRYDFATDELSLFYQTQVPGLEPDQYSVEQVFFASKDGTKVPMFIVGRKDLPRDGSCPTYLYGYGGFSISLTPGYSSFRMTFLKHLHGFLAIPNIRGGAEYGEDWHTAAIVHKRQNAFDDFIAAAEYLVAEKYTQPAKICISGGSNGGLLVATCANQRPDLFGCVLAQVGVLDMLRFHKFTIGHFWTSDFGSSDDPKEFETLLSYSPLHTIPAGKPYPALLLTTGDHDDRVVPLHSYKFIAEIQHTLGTQPFQRNPLLIRIETKAGHGAGKPTSKILDEIADCYAFVAKSIGAEWHD